MGKDFNATAFIFQMKNRFPKDYRDKHDVEDEGNIGFRQVWEIQRRSLASAQR
jgi:hypothetical protein